MYVIFAGANTDFNHSFYLILAYYLFLWEFVDFYYDIYYDKNTLNVYN